MATVLSLMTLTALALIGGAAWLWHRPGYRRQAVLMLVLSAVIAVNVAILTLPGEGGKAVASAERR